MKWWDFSEYQSNYRVLKNQLDGRVKIGKDL
jgi:hypothetical protein